MKQKLTPKQLREEIAYLNRLLKMQGKCLQALSNALTLKLKHPQQPNL